MQKCTREGPALRQQGPVRRPTAPLAPAPTPPSRAVLFLGIGSQFLPGHGPWCTLLLWAAGHLGGLIAYHVRVRGAGRCRRPAMSTPGARRRCCCCRSCLPCGPAPACTCLSRPLLLARGGRPVGRGALVGRHVREPEGGRAVKRLSAHGPEPLAELLQGAAYMASLVWSSSDPEPLFRCPQPQSPAASEGGSDGSSKGEEAAVCALGDAADGIAVTARPCRAATGRKSSLRTKCPSGWPRTPRT